MAPLLVAFVHGCGLAGLAVAIGGLVLDAAVFSSATPGVNDARWRLRRWITLALIGLFLIAPVDLLARTLAMSQDPLDRTANTLAGVLAGTHFGTVWIVREIALALAAGLSVARVGALRMLCMLVVLGVALTTVLTGHAAEWGDLTLSVGVDWAHVVAASAWTGGLIGLALLLRHTQSWAPETLGAVAGRFSRLAGACLLAVLVTGSYNAWAQLGSPSALWTTPYGRLLAAKLLLAGALVWFGALNRYLVVPRLRPDEPARGFGVRVFRLSRLVLSGRRRRAWAGPGRLATYLGREALLAVAVFACTALLASATPGRHAQAERRLPSHALVKSPRPIRGGAAVTSPPGDVGRGRAVFVRLGCFDCHAVAGEQFPAGRQPGPDLSGIGRQPSGYLLESIMNPDAMIVDGPGYTDTQGRSIMPDYRDRLTVGELIDLVAYLKSLAASQ